MKESPKPRRHAPTGLPAPRRPPKPGSAPGSSAAFDQTVLDALTAHLCVVDRQGRIVMVNRAWRAFAAAHAPPDLREMKGANFLILCKRVTGLDAAVAQETLRGLGAVADGVLPEFTLEYSQPPLEPHQWFELRVTRMTGAGSTALLVIVHRDISVRRRAESALRTSEERFRAVVEDQTEVICRFLPDGTFTFVNEVFCRWMHGQARDFIGQRWQPNVVAEDLPRIEEQLRRLCPANPVVVIENRGRAGDGSIRWMQFVNRGFFDAEGRLTEVQAVGRDITDRREAEDALRRHQERLAFLLRSTPAVIYTARPSGDFGGTFVSENVATLTGYEPGEFLNESDFWMRHVDPADLPQVLEQARRTMELGELRSEYRFHLKDGSVRWFEDAARVVKDSAGTPVEIAGYLLDITERKRAEEDRAQYATRLRELSRSLVDAHEAERRRLAQELHDEIGQLLTLLKIGIDSLPRLPIDEARSQCRELSGQLGRLISTVRDLSLDLRPSMLDDLGLVPALLWLFKRLEDRAQIRIGFEREHADDRRFDPAVEIAAYRITQEALTNMVRHAGTVGVAVRLHAEAEVLRLEIEDHGCGFDPASGPFSHTSAGLHGMRERAETLGGELMIETVPGVGTRVRAILPLHRDASAQKAPLP